MQWIKIQYLQFVVTAPCLVKIKTTRGNQLRCNLNIWNQNATVSDPQLFLVRIMEKKKSILPKLKFKTLSEQLTDDEFDKLLLKFREQIGRGQMLELLCDGSSDSQLSDLGGEVSPIIQQRKTMNEETDPSTSVAPNTAAITTLPTTMISEISSYLDQKAYARFATTNRKMFVDCNSPNRLVALDLDPVHDFNSISLANYPHLTSLEFNSWNVGDFDHRLIHQCRRLRTLMIHGDDDDDVEQVWRFNDDIDGVFTGITTLAMCGFSSLPPELLVQLLTLFPVLTHLRLFNVKFTNYLDTALLVDFCPSLNRLSLNTVEQETVFLDAFGGRITTLALSQSSSDFTPPNLDYSKLRRLCLYAPSQSTMSVFLKTSKNLEEVCFVPLQRKESQEIQRMTDSEIKRMTKRLIVDFKSIKFMHVSTRGHFEHIADSIQQGLLCTSSRKKEFMEIGLTVDCREITDFEDFMCSISRIMIGLAQSKTEKWILSLHANRHRSFEMDQHSMKQVVSALIASYKNLNVELLFAGEWKYVFGNKGCCFLDAHHDWWNDCWQSDSY